MAMAVIWTGMVAASILCGLATGREAEVAAGAVEGAAAAVELCLAMAGLLWLTPRIQDLLLGEKSRGKVYRLLASSLSATVGAMVFTVPLCAVYFGSLVLISPVSNLLCLTASSAVFMLGLLAVLASFLWLPLGAVVIPALFVPPAFAFHGREAGLLALILALVMLSRHIRGLGRILRGEEERKFRRR